MTAKELREKFEKDLSDLQKSCEHKIISDWVDEAWAPGHMTGRKVKYCLNCEKTINKHEFINDFGINHIDYSK